MRDFFLSASAWQIIFSGWIFFAGIYLAFGSTSWLLTRYILPALPSGQILDPRPLAKGQWQRELTLSAVSIFLFGAGLVFPWGMLQLGWAQLALAPSTLQILVEIIALVIWNEIHFYINHRLLHTPWLRRFHLPHHRSIVTTPWSTYSFHPLEAAMLGNVILLPMLVHDFSVIALLSLPLLSLLFNSIGHSNYDFKPGSMAPWREASRKHHLHHACFNGNYGFMFGFMDRLFGTRLPPDAAATHIDKWHARNQ